MEKRWDFVKEGEELFFGAKPAPSDFHVYYRGNECLAAFTRNPFGEELWLVLFNGQFFTFAPGGMCHTTYLRGEFTLVEAKDEVERLCEMYLAKIKALAETKHS